MKTEFENNWRSWAKLDIAQVTEWPDVPRRILIGTVALVIGGVLFTWVFLPMWLSLKQAQAQTVSLQQQFTQKALTNAQNQKLAQGVSLNSISPVSSANMSTWLAQLAEQAQQNQLSKVVITPVITLKSNNAKNTRFDKLVNDDAVSPISISVEGSYANVLIWTHQLAEKPEVLSIDKTHLTGIDTDKIKAEMMLYIIHGESRK